MSELRNQEQPVVAPAPSMFSRKGLYVRGYVVPLYVLVIILLLLVYLSYAYCYPAIMCRFKHVQLDSTSFRGTVVNPEFKPPSLDLQRPRQYRQSLE